MSNGYEPAAADELLKKLNRRFPPSEVLSRPQGGKDLLFIDIDMTINRFNEVLGANWSFRVEKSEIVPVEGTGKWMAHVQATLFAVGSARSGVGAMVNNDPDMAVKTAQAEAFKKCGHQYGVGLYLWDPHERMLVERTQAANEGNVEAANALKNQVALVAKAAGVEIKPEKLAEFFEVDKTDLGNPEVLYRILTEKE